MSAERVITSDNLTSRNEAAGSHSFPTMAFDLPSVEQILSGFPEKSTSLPARGKETVPLQEQERLFRSLKKAIEETEGTEAANSFDLKGLHASLEQADTEARLGRRNSQSAQSVRTNLDQLWSCNSEFLTRAAEILANGSRDREFIFA